MLFLLEEVRTNQSREDFCLSPLLKETKTGETQKMKCKNCNKKLTAFYFNVGGMELCLACAKEIINNIYDFKVQLNKKEDKNGNRK